MKILILDKEKKRNEMNRPEKLVEEAWPHLAGLGQQIPMGVDEITRRWKWSNHEEGNEVELLNENDEPFSGSKKKIW